MKDVALWLNDTILLGTGILVWRYVVATNKLVRNSQEQIRTSQQQVESQSLPAIVVQEHIDQLSLVNIGNGPALGIEYRFKDRGASPVFSESQDPGDALSYLEARQTKSIFVRPSVLVKRGLHCIYRSISGRRYISVSSFTEKGTYETQFHAE